MPAKWSLEVVGIKAPFGFYLYSSGRTEFRDYINEQQKSSINKLRWVSTGRYYVFDKDFQFIKTTKNNDGSFTVYQEVELQKLLGFSPDLPTQEDDKLYW